MKVLANPFEVIRTEDFNSNHKSVAQYFSDPGAPYYSNLARRGNTILVGTRGSGKSMLLKSLFLPVHIEILRRDGKDPLHHPLDFVGVWIPCERYEFKIFRENVFDYHKQQGDSERVRHFWKRCMGHYFALIVIEEILNTVIRYGPAAGVDLTGAVADKVASEIARICSVKATSKGGISFSVLGDSLKAKRKQFSQIMQNSLLALEYSVANDRFDLSAVIEVGHALKQMPRFAHARFYILLDDFFYPNLADEQQKLLLELVRVRNEPLAFKIATLPGGMVFTDDSGFELMSRGDEFGVESIEYPELGEGSDYYKLIRNIVNNRLAGSGITVDELFAESPDTMKEFLQKLAGKEARGHIRPEYAGFGTLVHMSSGVVRAFLVLANKVLDEWLKHKHVETLKSAILPISKELQTDVIYRESSLLLKSIESREQGMLMSKLVYYVAQQSRERLLTNAQANEYIQLQVSQYEHITERAQTILTRAVTNNVFHTYQLSHRTTRRGMISISSLVMNRLLTPNLRVPYRDRWRMDVPAEKINAILSDARPIDTSYHKPTRTLYSLYCPVISGPCDRIDSTLKGKGAFYASPIRTDWTAIARNMFEQQIEGLKFAAECPPRGDLTCKICEMIHATTFGLYELTDLNDNVVFELALALAREKHAFLLMNTEVRVQQIHSLLGVEYIPYQVVEETIADVCKKKIISVVNDPAPPWNAKVVRDSTVSMRENTVLLAMPRVSAYYERTLTKRVCELLERELGYQVVTPGDYKTGNYFRHIIDDIRSAKYCLIDTTRIPSNAEAPSGQCPPEQLDYLQRVFVFGLAVGLRKVTLHGFNSAYSKKIFTDLQGVCNYEYTDSSLCEEIRKRVPKVFV